MPQPFIADLSLTLINKTGAAHICRDVTENLPRSFAGTRYWRLHLSRPPGALARRLLGRAMLLELTHSTMASRLPPWGGVQVPRHPTLFFDPLYVLHARLSSRDIVLCHDVGPIAMSDLFAPAVSALYAQAYAQIRTARPGMVFVSAASRTAFTALFGDRFRFLEVNPLYVRPGSRNGPSVRPLGVRKPFLLTVGAQEIRKNYLRSIEAFARSALNGEGYSYVICGPRANQTDAVEELSRRTPGVQSLGYCSDAELRWLYQNASGFVLPSLLEGFGMPALEAAQHGLLSVISHEGALPEAVGEGAILVDPLCPESIAQGMRRLVEMSATERANRLAVARAHVAARSLESHMVRWSDVLAGS